MKKIAYFLPALLAIAACGEDKPIQTNTTAPGGGGGCRSHEGTGVETAPQVNDGSKDC